MRVWDISPAYLNRESLLGEHREVHAVISVIENAKKGYSRHPETLRWIGNRQNLNALKLRHNILVAEMLLRGFKHESPVSFDGDIEWPADFVDEPSRQFAILRRKYRGKEKGRIRLPSNTEQLLKDHALSLAARDINLSGKFGSKNSFSNLSLDFSLLLRTSPEKKKTERVLRSLDIDLNNFPDCVNNSFYSQYAAKAKGELREFIRSTFLTELFFVRYLQ